MQPTSRILPRRKSKYSCNCSYTHWLGSQWPTSITNWCSSHHFQVQCWRHSTCRPSEEMVRAKFVWQVEASWSPFLSWWTCSKNLESTTLHDGSRYVVGMLWADDNIHLPDNCYASLVQCNSRKAPRERLKPENSNASVIRDDVEKGYVVPVSAHDSKNRSNRESYVSQHPLLNPNKPGKVRRVSNVASKFHGKSLNTLISSAPICFRTFYSF